MFDGRESAPATGTTKILYNNYPNSLLGDLAHQAMDATNGHAQASPPLTISDPRLTPIVNFEMGLTTAQAFSNRAGLLNAHGAMGGPMALLNQPFFISINSSVHALLPQLEQPGGLVTAGRRAVHTGDLQHLRCVGELPRIRPAGGSGARAGDFQFETDQHHGRGRNQRRCVGWRIGRGRDSFAYGDMRHLPRYAERGRSLVPDAAEHWHRAIPTRRTRQ